MRRKSYSAPPVLTADERRDLEQRLRRKNVSKHHVMRASMLLMLADGSLPNEIAAALNIRPEKVRHWRCIFARERLAGLFRQRRVRPPSKYQPIIQQTILAIAAGPPPHGARWWTAKLIAEQLDGVLPSYIHNVIRRSGIDLRAAWRHRIRS